MFKKNSWIVALLLALSFSAFLIGCVDPVAEPPEDKNEYEEFELTEFNIWGGNKDFQAGWATDGSKDKGKPVKDIGLTVEMLQQSKYLVVELNEGFPKNKFEFRWDSYDADGNKLGDWVIVDNITDNSGVINPGKATGEKGGAYKVPIENVVGNYGLFMNPATTEIHLILQHWGNGGPSACVKSAKLLISTEPVELPPFVDVTDITLPGAGGNVAYTRVFTLSTATVAPNVAPNIASKTKILWSIRRWVSGDGATVYDLDGVTNAVQAAAVKAKIKSKVDFATAYNENDEAVLGRDAIIAIDGINSVGTVTLLATIKDAKYNKDKDEYSDFTKKFTFKFIEPLPYTVPASGTGYFYVDLNEWDTQTPSTANINAVVPSVDVDTGKITVPFTGGNNQRVNFKLTDAQRDLLMAIPAGNKVTVNINAAVVGTAGGSNDKFRYHIGNALSGSNWNATTTTVEGILSTITGAKELDFGGNKSNETCKYLILQHRVDDNITIEITSIRITYGATAAAPSQITVTFSDGNPKPGNNGTVVIASGGNGFTFTYGTVADSDYGNGIVRFKVDLGAAQLKDYEKVTFTWTGVSGDAASSKKLYLLATDTESAITPWKDDDAVIALVVSSNNTGNTGEAFWGGDGPQVNGTTAQDVTLNIIKEKTYTGEVWFAVWLGSSGGSYTISNLKFVPK